MCLAEVMSPPRVVPIGVERGCRDGGSFDLDTGWDLLDDDQQNRCIERMGNENVDVVVVTPPCDQFSKLQDLSKGNGDPI